MSDAVTASQAEWLATRRYLTGRRIELARSAVHLYPDLKRVSGTALLARDEWLLDEPVDLDRVSLTWSAAGPPAVDGSEPESAIARPLHTPDERFRHYSD